MTKLVCIPVTMLAELPSSAPKAHGAHRRSRCWEPGRTSWRVVWAQVLSNERRTGGMDRIRRDHPTPVPPRVGCPDEGCTGRAPHAVARARSVVVMTRQNRDDVREFLTTRRAKVRPDQVDLAAGSNRRVPGLRRTEVALLAGVSVEYYSRLERGDLAGASESVLHAIAGALQLDDAERDHLFDLARAAGPSPKGRPRRSARNPVVRPSLQHALDAITGGPALVRNGRMDIIAANTLGRALHVDAYTSTPRPVNLARHAF
jgi:transcriptional regulator with XRE-family HTH domain